MLFALCYSASAQQPKKIPRIGYLSGSGGDAKNPGPQVEAFRQGLRDLGYVKSKDIAVEYRFSDGNPTHEAELARELVRLNLDVIVIGAFPAIRAAKETTKSIPIVMTTTQDPVATGMVDSLARPGGNITGFTQFEYSLAGKWLDLLMEIAPRTSRVAVLRNPTRGTAIAQFAVIQAMAPARAVEPIPIDPSNVADMESRISAFASAPHGAMIATVGSIAIHRAAIIAAANNNHLPTIYPYRYYAADGGLVSYGPDTVDQYRRAASYIDRILKGENPASLPVQGQTKYELTINLKTAKTLGLTVPQSILARADEVIE